MATDISHKELIAVLIYQPETGEFTWQPGVPNYSRYKDEVGYINAKGQRFININRKSYAAHRLAWFYVNKEWPSGIILPVDGDYLNLRFDNLKDVTTQEFSATRKARNNPTSGITGVSWDKTRNRWVAYITINYKRRHLGYFHTKEEAAHAYEAANAARQIGANATPSDIAAKREAGRKDARYRALWRRTVRHSGNSTGWRNIAEFVSDIGPDLHDRQNIVAVDETKPVGPGNWKWELSLFYRYDTTTPEGRKAYENANRERNPLRHRAREFYTRFGLTLEDYHRMHDAQGGLCACCGGPETDKRAGKIRWLAVDHCHSTGAIRGLLCGGCNKGIGHFRDDPNILRKAADYLDRHAMKSEHGAASPPPPIEERKAHHGNYSP